MKSRRVIKTGRHAREAREGVGQAQQEFWGRIFVSQSSASRYENEKGDRPLPAGIAALLNIAYGDDSTRAKTISRILHLG